MMSISNIRNEVKRFPMKSLSTMFSLDVTCGDRRTRVMVCCSPRTKHKSPTQLIITSCMFSSSLKTKNNTSRLCHCNQLHSTLLARLLLFTENLLSSFVSRCSSCIRVGALFVCFVSFILFIHQTDLILIESEKSAPRRVREELR